MDELIKYCLAFCIVSTVNIFNLFSLIRHVVEEEASKARM